MILRSSRNSCGIHVLCTLLSLSGFVSIGSAQTPTMNSLSQTPVLSGFNPQKLSGGVLRIQKTGTGSVLVTNESSNSAGTLSGGGDINGDVTLQSTSAQAIAQIYPDGIITNKVSEVINIKGNLSFATNSRPVFNVNVDAKVCDRIILSGNNSILSCGDAQVALSLRGEQLSGGIPLISLAGSGAKIVGNFNPKPVWIDRVPLNADNYSIVTKGNQVILQYNVPHVTMLPKVLREWPRLYCGPDDRAQIKKQIEAIKTTGMNPSGVLEQWADGNTNAMQDGAKHFWETLHKQYDNKEYSSGRRLAETIQSFNIYMAAGNTSEADYKWFEGKVATYINKQFQITRYSDTLSRHGMGNGDLEQFYPMLQAAVLFPNHPDAPRWLDRSVDWLRQCARGYWIDGVGLESDRYVGTVTSELASSLPIIEHCTGENLYRSPELRAGLEWWFRYLSPPVPYTLPAWGDADVGFNLENHVPYIKEYAKFDPDFSRRIAGWWRKSGGRVNGGWMNPLIAPQNHDITLPGSPENTSAPATSTYSPTFGQATLRSESNDTNELFLSIKCGLAPNGHCHGDQGTIELYGQGQMLLTETYCGPYDYGMDWSRASAAHNTVVYDDKNTDGTRSGEFLGWGASKVADYCAVRWMGANTSRNVVMVKPDYVVIWDHAPAGNFSDYWMHAKSTQLKWGSHSVQFVMKTGNADVDVHFLLPSYNLPKPTLPSEPITKNGTTTNWLASQIPEPKTAGPYTREGLGQQAFSWANRNPPADSPGSKFIKYFSVRSATQGGDFLTILHPRKTGVTPELVPQLVSSSATNVVVKVNYNGRIDTIEISDRGAIIAKGGETPVQFARTYPWSGVSGPARFVLCRDNAVETLDKPLVTTGGEELIIGKLVIGADNVLTPTAPLTIRPCGVIDLNGHNVVVDKLTMDCGKVIGTGTITCNSVDWYGGDVSKDSKIICHGKFQKFAGSIESLPSNISCDSGMTEVGEKKQTPANPSTPIPESSPQ